jgi:hypothetical protein
MIRAEETAPHLSHREPLDSDLTAFEIFKAHDEIGPGLTISEQILVPKPPGSYDAYWVQQRVVTRQPRYPPQQWSAIAIAVKE